MTAPRSEHELITELLHDRDIPCGSCNYNLRGVTTKSCPECGNELHLWIGEPQVKIGALIATLVPSIFSGICAMLFAIPVLMTLQFATSYDEILFVCAVEAFGLISGAAGLTLFAKRKAYLNLPSQRRTELLLATWFVHILATIITVAIGVTF